MKKIAIISGVVLMLALGSVFVLFFVAMSQGPSIDTLTNRVCQNLMVSPSKLRCIGGYTGRDPHVFFMLSGEIPEKADVRVLKGWSRDDNVKSFNRLAAAYQIPCVVKEQDELLNYKGDVFDLYMTKTIEGYCVLYFGF